MAGYETFEGRPKMEKWLKEVKEQTNPSYDEAHQMLNKVAGQWKGERKSKLASNWNSDAVVSYP